MSLTIWCNIENVNSSMFFAAPAAADSRVHEPVACTGCPGIGMYNGSGDSECFHGSVAGVR